MAELVLGLGRQDTEGFRKTFGNKKGIIPKAARADFLCEELAFDAAMRDMQDFAITGEDHAALKASAEGGGLLQLGEFSFQFRAVVSSIRIFSSVAGATHSRITAQSIDFETGVIRQHQQARHTTAAAHSFDDGVGFKSIASFFIQYHTRVSAEIFDLPALSEDGGDFFSLVCVGGGKDEAGHGEEVTDEEVKE